MTELTAEIKKELSPDFNQQVYQDPVTKGLFTFKREELNKIIIGGGSGYYNSAITGLLRYAVSKEYFANFIPITKESSILEIDTCISSKGYIALKVKGWDCVKNDYIFQAIHNSKQLEYLEETNLLIKANRERYSDFDNYANDD